MPRYSVARSTVIQANPQTVFDVLSDFKTWTTWSPWLIAEPDAKVTISERSSAVGSTYHWQGNCTGEGIIEHKQLTPASYIESDLNFIKPFKSFAKTMFELRPVSGGTEATWTMNGNMPWFMFWMIPMLKTFIGMDYARGLAMAKDWIETGAIPSKTIVQGVEAVGPIRMAGIAASSSVAQIGSEMEQAFSRANSEFERLRIPMDQPMISVYTKFRMKDGVFDYISGYIIPDHVQIPAGSELKTWSLPAGKAFHVDHIGSYRHLGNGWSVANQLARHQKLKQSKIGTFEVYRTTPPETPEENLKTEIYLPLR